MKKTELPNAEAVIRGSKDYPGLRGLVKFYEEQNCVLVEAVIQGLPDNGTGFFGFHIHEGNSCTGADFADTVGHYNPDKTPHPLHAGDLPPLMSCHSNAFLAVATSRFKISDIIGKTVVLHSMADDLHTQPSGNAGTKIACGMIRRV